MELKRQTVFEYEDYVDFSIFRFSALDNKEKLFHVFFMKLIYIIEDHEVIRDGVRQYLEFSGYQVQAFGDLRSAGEAFHVQVPDLLIQDVMLPDGDGFSFVRQIKTTYDFPVIFMTARVTESDRILGFELGADDYISKPFSPKELVLRVQAIFRRIESGPEKPQPMIWYSGNDTLELDEAEHVISINKVPVILTAAEWRILSYLIHHASIVVSRSHLLEHCFDYHFETYERIIDSHIKNIRAKLGANTSWIVTVRGYGYRFAGTRSREE